MRPGQPFASRPVRGYVSKVLMARPGGGDVDAVIRYYRMKFESKNAEVLSITPETIETVCDPDTAVRAIFYNVHVNYRGTTAFKPGSMD